MIGWIVITRIKLGNENKGQEQDQGAKLETCVHSRFYLQTEQSGIRDGYAQFKTRTFKAPCSGGLAVTAAIPECKLAGMVQRLQHSKIVSFQFLGVYILCTHYGLRGGDLQKL